MTTEASPPTVDAYLLSDAFAFYITEHGAAVHIVLVQTATRAVKEFRLARGCKASLTQHMLSLTDVQCADWFKGANTKARKAP